MAMQTLVPEIPTDDDCALTIRESEHVRLMTLIHGAQSIAEALEQESTPGTLFSSRTAQRLRALQWLALDEADDIVIELPRSDAAVPSRNRLGNILADAAALPDADMDVLVSMLRGMRNGMDMDPDSLRSASDNDLRALAHGRPQ
ncbi:hypothetical protein ABQJ54_03790 [Rhodanobacter sp. Si-c]|uniref:Uncharacterized protein n=1 Tax=Rhodanobacter lycopersici TaxID=3162487 RepID=A0ABV3QB98_9GAMM